MSSGFATGFVQKDSDFQHDFLSISWISFPGVSTGGPVERFTVQGETTFPEGIVAILFS
jgi:hypothetical protein